MRSTIVLYWALGMENLVKKKKKVKQKKGPGLYGSENEVKG